MLRQNKIFSKIENYWLNDFDFRKMINRWEVVTIEEINRFVDLNLGHHEFFELKSGLRDLFFDPPHPKDSQFTSRTIYYQFGWKLGLEGKLALLKRNLRQKKFFQEPSLSRLQSVISELKIPEYEGDEIQCSEFFYQGFTGNLKCYSGWNKRLLLLNRAGFDLYIQN